MRKVSLLVVDDERDVLSVYGEILQEHGYEVTTAESGGEARQRMKDRFFDLLILDDRMPGISGTELLEECRRHYAGIGGIFITGHATTESAIRALRAGAIDLLQKPVDKEMLLNAVKRALAESQIVREQRYRHNGAETHFDKIIGDSEALRKVLKVVRRVIPTNTTVLLQGESGTGKELLARAIHFEGPRKDKPFIPVFASAIPQDLIESTLFGHRKGAFTGALENRKGVFEEANDGTVLLDEIGDLTLDAQVKLLRVLQEKTVTRLGENCEIPVNVRVIAATHRNLESQMKAEKFREDLLFRINVMPIELPPLRDRMEDIPALTNYLVGIHCPKIGKSIKAVSPAAHDKLCCYPWPGNIRELDNVIQRAIILADTDTIMPDDIELSRSSGASLSLSMPFHEANENFERLYFKELLTRAKDNKTKAAELAGLERTVLYAHLNKLNLLTKKANKS